MRHTRARCGVPHGVRRRASERAGSQAGRQWRRQADTGALMDAADGDGGGGGAAEWTLLIITSRGRCAAAAALHRLGANEYRYAQLQLYVLYVDLGRSTTNTP